LTGQKKYIDLAKFLLDKRGYTGHKDAYNQSHKSVLQQDEEVGHAVRAAYMYSGIADVPESWKIYYKDAQGLWIPVENTSDYGVEKGTANEVVFKPVTTSALKIEVKLRPKVAAGFFEWEVE
jgi:hypothetical protein